MADEELRRIERLARSGDPDAIERLRRHRERTGTWLPAVHYVPDDYHVYLDADGKFTIDRYRDYDARGRIYEILSTCKVRLWPRGERTQRKICRFTRNILDVTCKTCLRSLNAPKVRRTLRRHYAPGSYGGRITAPVCGKNDSAKYREVLHHTMRGVTCATCIRIMQRGRRLPRTPRDAANVLGMIVDDMSKIMIVLD